MYLQLARVLVCRLAYDSSQVMHAEHDVTYYQLQLRQKQWRPSKSTHNFTTKENYSTVITWKRQSVHNGNHDSVVRILVSLSWMFTWTSFPVPRVALFPGSSPAFCRILYSMRQKLVEYVTKSWGGPWEWGHAKTVTHYKWQNLGRSMKTSYCGRTCVYIFLKWQVFTHAGSCISVGSDTLMW